MVSFRATHRFVTVVIVVFTLYLSVTGLMIQTVDLHSIFTDAPADDPNVLAMREASDGPGDYAVLEPKDYTAANLPQGADLAGMLAKTLYSTRLTVGNVPLRYVELRMAGDKPVGIVESSGRLARFDATTGEIISAGPPPRDPKPPVSQFHQSPRNMWKVLHRMTLFGRFALFINVIVGVGLSIMIFTGLVIYFRIWRTRTKAGVSSNLFWAAGGRWRSWHRGISILAAVFLTVVTLSGLWLSVESLYFGYYLGSAKQHADNQAFAAAQLQRNPVRPPVARLDPMSAEAEPGRLASMKHDIGLSDDEMVKVKAITDDSVQKNIALRQPGADPQKMMGLHQAEANAILAVLPEDQKPKFQAWRDAQLLGLPAPAGGMRGGGAPGGAAPKGAGGAQSSGSGNRPGPPAGGGLFGPGPDPSSPLKDAELPAMLAATLNAEQAALPNRPVKVVRLRYYAGMPQGAVVVGGASTKQYVFDTSTGKPVSETEPGYPPVGFPFGWQAHQTAKNIHRGGIIGVPGRLMDMFAGLSMLYLSVSGIAIYFDMWKRRRKAGRKSMIWA